MRAGAWRRNLTKLFFVFCSSVVRCLQQAQHDVVGVVFSRTPKDGNVARVCVKCDLRDAAAIAALCAAERPDVVIHCAAERKPDVCDTDEAATLALNVDVSRNVAEAAKGAGAWLVALSTDYVFDGAAPPYNAASQPNPLSLYGRSKLLGEQAARAVLPHCAILRVGVLYGTDQESLDESAVTQVLKTVRASVGAGVPIAVDAWAARYPIHVDDVSGAIIALVVRHMQFSGFFGTFHLCGSERVTKFDMAKLFARLDGVEASANLAANEAEPSGSKRPKDSRLDCRALLLFDCVHRRKLADGFKTVVDAFPRCN